MQDCLEIGNLDTKRDWGFAGDFVELMWISLQKENPGDYILATGETHTIREFVEEAFNILDMPLQWKGKGLKEEGIFNGKTIVKINEKFYRPGEAEWLFGDISKAKKELGWKPKTKFSELVKIMVNADLERNKKVKKLKELENEI